MLRALLACLLSLAAGVRAPAVAAVIDDAPNCLTVGRTPDRAWIVVTTGLVERLPKRELEAVLAYELGRVVELEVSLDTVVYALTGKVFELWAAAFDDVDEDGMQLRLAEPEPGTLFRLGLDGWRSGADALVISCLNTRSHTVITALEQATGKPVITSTQATLWHALRLAGVRDAIAGYGRLLAEH